MASSVHPGEPFALLTLELTSNGSDEVGSVRRIELNDGGIRLIVTLPRLIDGEQANLTAALLFQQIDNFPEGAKVDRVKLSSLNFTTEGVVGVQGFLSLHAETVKHVSMKDMLSGSFTQEDEEAFVSLAKVFQGSERLETLNLSDNVIGASMWSNWAVHTSLRQLILDYVEMDDDSVTELYSNFSFAESLEELYVVLTNNVGPRGLKAANNILRRCRRLSSLRWAVKDAPSDALLPWSGLAKMAEERIMSRNTPSLYHLVMDGGTISNEDLGSDGLAGALRNLKQLRTIKLRSIGLKDDGAQLLINALMQAKPPLETLDLSRNQIQSSGALEVAKLVTIESVNKNLGYLSLDRNHIEAGGARAIMESFGTKANPKLDVRLDGNPFPYGKVAFSLAVRKVQAEMERDQLRSELSNSDGRSNSHYEMRQLQEEVARLKEEKTALLKAFSIMGSLNQLEDSKVLFDRVTQLEMKVFSIEPEDNKSKSRLMQRKASADTICSAPQPPLSSGHQEYNTYFEQTPVKSPARAGLASHLKKMSPRQPSSAASSPDRSRRASMMSLTKDSVSPLGHYNGNLLVRGTSERWSSPVSKKKPPTQGAPNHNYMKNRSKSANEIEDAAKATSHSRRSYNSDDTRNAGSSREIEYNPAWGSYSATEDHR